MPTLEKSFPDKSAKQLQRKQAAHMRAWAYFRSEYEGRSASRLRRLVDGLMEEFEKSDSPDARCKLANAIVNIVEQQRVLFKFPAPGREDPHKVPMEVSSSKYPQPLDVPFIMQEAASTEQSAQHAPPASTPSSPQDAQAGAQAG